jgi:hypothetical protein
VGYYAPPTVAVGPPLTVQVADGGRKVVSEVHDGVRLLGLLFESKAYVRAELGRMVGKLRRSAQRVYSLDSLQSRFLLLRFCLQHRLNFLFRNLPCLQVQEAARALDGLVAPWVASSLNLSI